MKAINILLGLAAILPLTGCLSENPSSSKATGELSVEVATKKPYSTKGANDYKVTDFPVTIFAADGTTKLYSYETVASMPAALRLEVGTYVLESHTPGTMTRLMKTPYYKGRAQAQILKDVTTNETITCKQANGSIKVNYDADFLALFTSWSISFDDGGSQALSYTESEGTNPAADYIQFAEGVKKITANFRGTTTAGNTISASMTLTKSQATETYDGDSIDFGGGDAIVVNLSPVEATTGNVSISITASILFEETQEEVIIDVVDNVTLKPVDPTPDPEPGTDTGITITLPANMTVTNDTPVSAGDAKISATNGLQSIVVKIVSTSDDMVSSLGDLGEQYGVDFIKGAEIVENQDVVSLFASLSQTLAVPAVGDTEYTFPIGNFFGFLTVLPGQHSFYITVTDCKGNTKTTDTPLILTI